MKAHKAFTLVEILIVIVIIAILASAMLLSSSDATASAEAANILSDLRSLKVAALALYASSMDHNLVIDDWAANSIGSLPLLAPYMDNPEKLINSSSAYEFFKTNVAGVGLKWWVVYDLDRGGKSDTVAAKLAGKAKSVGLYLAANGGATYQPFGPSDRRAHLLVR